MYSGGLAPRAVIGQGLVESRGVAIERSIHSAYIAAIRKAENFVYIENQYFMGSSYAWLSNQDSGKALFS